MRADAARNRQRVLDTARALYSVQGLDVPVEAVARAAGVGIGTVYRHFPDRTRLVQAVVADRLAHVGGLLAAARTGLDGDDPAAAWDAFLGGFLDSGLPVLLPVLVPHARDADVFTEELVAVRARTANAAGEVVRTAQRLGLVRDDVGTPEIVLMFAAAMHGTPGLPDEVNSALLARRTGLLRAALRPGGDPLPGERVDVEDLLALLARP
ncbi:TetR/AcrR family transcriptional regulator [Cellulomonas triticagri]|nr:TetR/AcrR family transcriptional regulator [Cellulomonas triticagri]